MVKAKPSGLEQLYAKDRKSWREWLEKNHSGQEGVWLVIRHKSSNLPGITYEEAIEESICFGWVDSTINKKDEESYLILFAKRNPGSNWSQSNRVRAQKMIEQGLMTEAGLEMIEDSQENGQIDDFRRYSEVCHP